MGSSAPSPPKLPPSADELEQKRRLALVRAQQAGRGSTLLTSGALSDTASASQTLLGS